MHCDVLIVDLSSRLRRLVRLNYLKSKPGVGDSLFFRLLGIARLNLSATTAAFSNYLFFYHLFELLICSLLCCILLLPLFFCFQIGLSLLSQFLFHLPFDALKLRDLHFTIIVLEPALTSCLLSLHIQRLLLEFVVSAYEDTTIAAILCPFAFSVLLLKQVVMMAGLALLINIDNSFLLLHALGVLNAQLLEVVQQVVVVKSLCSCEGLGSQYDLISGFRLRLGFFTIHPCEQYK